jgi:vacuolar protein sorting-associated protein 53
MQGLPLEIIASIQRILELEQNDANPMDSLDGFHPLGTLNTLLPNGIVQTHPTHSIIMIPCLYVAEEALGDLDAIQIRLHEDQRALQDELEVLYGEMQRDHDPDRMQDIQELISVC